ncbi:MAG TPA: hypothetical protein VIG32_08770 [Candidatus Baltobacteraceae bacterium]
MKNLALGLAILFVILAILTATGIASFFPAIGLNGHPHMKHTIMYVILAVLCFIWMRFAANASPAR